MSQRIICAVLFTAVGLYAQAPQDMVDKNVNPCVNFYQYACGTWLKNNPVPPDQPSWARFDALQERNNETLHKILEKSLNPEAARDAVTAEIGDAYAACMNESNIEHLGLGPVREHLDRIAKLPNKIAITDELIRLNRIGVRPYFVFDSQPDAKDASMMIGGLDQGGLLLPDRDYYLKTDAASVELRQKYIAHIAKMFVLAGVDPQIAAKNADTVLRIETRLAKMHLDLVSRRDPNKTYHKYTVAQLVSLSPGIDWLKFFAAFDLAKMETLNVAYPPAIRGVESAIVEHSLDETKAYLAWHLLHSAAPMLPVDIQKENFAFYGRTLGGSKEMRARWKRCVTAIDRDLGDALGQKYVDLTFGKEGKSRTLTMVKEIEESMARDIKSLDWMSPATKDQALTKLHAIVNKIGYPDKWKDYSAAKVDRADPLGNQFRLAAWHTERELAKIGKPLDKSEWQMSPPTVNAYYDPQMNDINFPAGILQPPFYDNKADDAANYGAIGAVIGHELTHGFDDEGRQFDARGNLRDWWTAEDAKKFDDRAKCIAAQYSKYPVVDDLKLNGELTLGENAADNGGVRLALMSLLARPQKKVNGLSAEQRFFLGYGQIWCENSTPEYLRLRAQTDPHSTAEARVNGVVSNMPEFQKAFSCKPGDPMVSAKACRVW